MEPSRDTAPSPADAQRRARIAARAGDVFVTVGEVEDFLLTLTRSEAETFRTPAGRRGIVERLLRGRLLALEAERRGALDPVLSYEARRREERALRDQLELDIRRSPSSVPPPSAPVEIPEERFAIVLRSPSRANVEQWMSAVRGESFHLAIERAEGLGEAQQTPYGTRARPPEAGPPIEPSVWRAVFATPLGQVAGPIQVATRRWAGVLVAGVTGGYVDTGPDENARRMLAADREWAEFRSRVVADRVRDLDPTALDGVRFRLPEGMSLERQRAIAAELAAQQATAAAQGDDP